MAGSVAGADDAAAKPFPKPVPRFRHLGYGRLNSNDIIGDGKDRWRTGAISMSRAWGSSWTGTAPAHLGELLETRIVGQVIAPEDLRQVDPTDRPYAGASSIGLHTHARMRGIDMSLGVDVVVIGPQTHLGSLQNELHEVLGREPTDFSVLASQIANQIRPTFVAEFGGPILTSSNLAVRPFAELRAGDETLARVGVDLSLGPVGRGELLVRDSVTGHRYRVIYRSQPGFAMVLGADIAQVWRSEYLPKDRGYSLTRWRGRIRLGGHWQGKKGSAFYGLTYLSPEFEAQRESQIVGSLRIKLRF